jgi:zinc and cadmium transporter
MGVLAWIIVSGMLMSAIALTGSITLLLKPPTLNKLLLPLVAIAAGNFIYIAASDLVPEVNKHADASMGNNIIHLVSFTLGLFLLLIAAP